MAEPVEFEIRVDEGEAIRDLQRLEAKLEGVGRASERMGTASGKSAKATKGLSKASKAAGRDLGMQVNEVTEMMMGLGALNPRLREVSMGFAMAGNSAVTMGASMGPIGVLVAGITMGLPPLIALINDSGDAAEDAASGFDAMTASLNDAISRLRELDELDKQYRRRESGQQSTEEARADRLRAAGQVQSRQRDLERRLRDLGIDPSTAQNVAAGGDTAGTRQRIGFLARAVGADREGLEQAIAALDRLGDARDEVTAATERQVAAQERLNTEREREKTDEQTQRAERERSASSRSRGRSGRSRGVSAQDSPLTLDSLETELAGNAASTIAGIDTPEAVRLQQLEEEREIQKELVALQGQAAYEEAQAQLRQAAKNKLAEEELQTEQEKARVEAELQATKAKTFDLVNQGVDTALDIFEANEGTKELILGASQIAQAIGSYPDGFGIAQHGISAALHFANAAKLGVGGGGGGAAVPSPNASRPTPPPGFGGGGNHGSGTTVMNFNSPVPEALMGQYQRRAERAFKARYDS